MPDPIFPIAALLAGLVPDAVIGDAAETLPSSGSLQGLLLPGGALLALAGVAILLTLRKKRLPGSLRIVESISIGPKRSLVIAQVGDDQLVLGCSEAGIALLATRPAPPEPPIPTKSRRGSVDFDELLDESASDQELRHRLANGLPGRVG
ncbi:flagellar biosynthetic protein FliO [Vulgatibacter incomptus]|uniref:4Fe-4S ferredoxin iron-sulfur binding domain protein n=1 Tax=Vulgatibacter incomptus TaxID=1391653 RepID=A0A0K1PIS9_9BACT|nr:flagellar biosynthetic protein FliO [Vulgatibacter incomptus]AKU93014.1 4Fe-4S ferredoxin iron-sulfur binding domain protein [Vulgatibacter incomptus]